MPSISNVRLTIQRNSENTSQASPRNVEVSFTTSFTQREMFAHVVYKAEVNLRSQNEEGLDPSLDDGALRLVGTRIISSTANQVQTTVTSSLQRILLNEDFDHRPGRPGEPPIEVAPALRDDEWVAEVKLTPHVFPTVVAQSPVVVGSWGFLGQD